MSQHFQLMGEPGGRAHTQMATHAMTNLTSSYVS